MDKKVRRSVENEYTDRVNTAVMMERFLSGKYVLVASVFIDTDTAAMSCFTGKDDNVICEAILTTVAAHVASHLGAERALDIATRATVGVDERNL